MRQSKVKANVERKQKQALLFEAQPLHSLLFEGLATGDFSPLRSVLADEIEKRNKLQLAKKAGVGRRTLYDILDPNMVFNPNLSTISAIIRGLYG